MIEEAWSIIGNHIIPAAHALWNEELKDEVASHVSSYATDLMHYAWCRRKGKKKKKRKKERQKKIGGASKRSMTAGREMEGEECRSMRGRVKT